MDKTTIVGKYIREVRQGKQFSLKYVADYIGVTQQFVCNVENGKSPLPVRLVRKISQVLSVDPFNLIEQMTEDHAMKLLKDYESSAEYDA